HREGSRRGRYRDHVRRGALAGRDGVPEGRPPARRRSEGRGEDPRPGPVPSAPPLPEGEGRLDAPEGTPSALHPSEGRLGRGLNRGPPGIQPWLTRRDRAARATGATPPDSGAG